MKFKRIYLELSNYCNLNCVFCTPANKNSRMIDLSLAKKAIDESSLYTNELCLHVLGEPLIYPNFFEVVEYANDKNLNIMLSTNTRLIKKYESELLNVKIKTFNFSLHSLYSMSDYKEYILYLLDFINKYQDIYKDSVFHLRLWADSNKEIKETNEKIKEILFKFYNYTGDFKSRIRLKERVILSYEEEFTWPSLESDYNTEGYCLGGKSHIGILSDGNVVMCCLDTKADTNLGNIKKSSLTNILNDRKYKLAREHFNNNKCYFNLCKHCSYKDKR